MKLIFSRMRSNVLCLLAVSTVTVALTGCGMGALSGPVQSTETVDVNISGTVHGGQQPISGAVIQLNVVGSSGYGSPTTGLITGANATTVGVGVTDSNGNFSLSGKYTCPAAPSNATTGPYVYITATGGNPGSNVGGVNVNSVLGAALGTCASISGTTIIINEVTTAAMAYALGQYFNTATSAFTAGADNFGAPNTTQGQIGLANAFGTAANLANTVTGAAQTTLPLSANGLTITGTPESAKLYTVANILAACVNSKGIADTTDTNCNTLFGSTGGATPVDTLQAAVNMSLNPTSGGAANVQDLYNLQSATSPYPGETAPFTGVGTQPTDWTIGILYTDSSSPLALPNPEVVSIDTNGNVWVLSGSTTGNLAELSPTGTPLLSTIATSGSATLSAASPRNMAIDTNNNVWITSSTSSAYVFEYIPSSSTSNTYATSKSSYGLAIDGSNNVYVGSASTTSHFELFEFPGGDITKQYEFPIASSTPGTAGVNGTNSFVLPEYMAFDTAGNLWMTNGSATTGSSANQNVQLSNIAVNGACTGAPTYPCLLTTSTTQNTFTGISLGSPAAPFGLAAGNNVMWSVNSTTSNNSLTALTVAGTAVTAGNNYTGGGLTSPRFPVVDGAGNVWVSDKSASPGAVSEFNSAGTALSTSTGAFIHAGMSSANTLAVDPSGNIWVPNNVTSGTDADSIFEIVGAAAPTVTPIALALKNGTVAAKP